MVDVSMHSKIFVLMQIYGDFPGRELYFWLVKFHKMKKKLIILFPCLKDYYYICGINIRNGICKMDFTNIQHLISQKESVNIEFKKSTGQLERGMETLCSIYITQAPHKHHISIT